MGNKPSGKPFGIREVIAAIPDGELLPPASDTAGGLELNLPLPPSVNRLMARLGNSSNVVQRWWRAADNHLMSDPAEWRRIQAGAVKGIFVAEVVWDKSEFGRSDIDNRVKILLDYLQRLQLIGNDRLCRAMTVSFGTAPDGCRVWLKPWDWQS